MESAAAAPPATAQAAAPPACIFSMSRAFGGFGVVTHLAFAWAVPIFVLIWFSRRKITREINTWRSGA
jgi:hypothetical protein